MKVTFLRCSIQARSLGSWWLCILFLLVPLSSAQVALTSGEIAALSQLYSNFPSLAIAHRHIYEFPEGTYFGKAWTTNFTSYCDHGEGYEYNGVYCHDGHISGITVNQQWDTQLTTNYSLISGLQYLKNYTNTAIQNAELLIAIVQVLPVEHIKGSDATLTDTEFAYPTAVLSLEGTVSNTFNISSFTSLQELNLNYYPPLSVIDTWVWPSASLESLQLGPLSSNFLPVSWWLDHYHLFPVLRVLKGVWNAGTAGTMIPAVLESQTLQQIDISLSDSVTPVNLTIICSTCLELTLNWRSSSVNISAPALQKLTITTVASWPVLLKPLPDMNELVLQSVGQNDPPSAFPNLDFAPSLKSFEWSFTQIDHANWVRVLCSLPSTLESLSLSWISKGQQAQFPACLNTLRSVRLSESTQGEGYDATTLFLNLPSTITSLALSNLFREPVTIDNLKKFTHLRSLRLIDTSWRDLPSDLLTYLPQLTDFYCDLTYATGTIPSVGWSQLETFTLFSSATAWEGIDSAPNLKQLYVSSSFNSLSRLPSNEQFIAANLQSLVYLSVVATRGSGPALTFWSSLPKIEEVYLQFNQFSGPFNASISSTSLIWADLSHNKICGSLPEVTVPIKLDVLRFHENQFSGSIPDSWSVNLSYISELTFHSNPINGTIPGGLIEKNTNPDLSDTNLVGPVWNMSLDPPHQITIINSGIDLCIADPEIPSGIQPICIFNNVTECPDACPSYWPCSAASPPCNRLTFVPQAVGECIAPPMDSGAQPESNSVPLQCPPPSPPGFACINGQYISNGSVTFVVVTLPSQAGIIVVKGNLSVNGTLTFSGLGSTVEVEGCLEVAPSEVHIVLTSLDALPPTTLINQKGSDCSNDLSKIPVIVDETKHSCKRSKHSTSDSTRASLVVAFAIDSTRCNVKWIILGSTLGGVLVLAAISVIILHVSSPSFRLFFKKHSCC